MSLSAQTQTGEATTEEKQKHWSRISESGTSMGIRFLAAIEKLFGRRVFSLILVPTVAYFYIAKPIARRASKDFLETHRAHFPNAWERKVSKRDVLRHLYAFGQSVLDKSLAWTTPIDEALFDIPNKKQLEAFLNQPEGQLIIGSHFGNLEFCRGFVERYKAKTINILVYDRHAANFIKVMSEQSPESRVNVYQVDELDIPTILLLKTKLAQGEWCFIAGDRVPLSGDARTTRVSFLSRKIDLPIGPYLLAKTLDCEVQLMFSYRLSINSYERIRFVRIPFAKRIKVNRKNRDGDLNQLAQRYADELAAQVEHAPYQWFNFFPYFASERALDDTPPIV